ncbi:MAG: NUDIX hydrolase [Candidatus Pacearchaeota archaeon]
MIKEIVKNRDKIFVIEWHKTKDFSKIKPITQVYGVCFNDKGKVLIVKPGKEWGLPGGTPEKGEDFEETLKREALEEGDVEIYDLRPLGYQKVWITKNKAIYQLRYFARISKVKKQTIDPATRKVNKRKFIQPKEFLKYCPWGKIGKEIVRLAVREYES